MFGKSLKLTILTMDRIAFDGDVVSVVAPGSKGLFGVLAGHAPLVGSLEKGMVKIRYMDSREEFIAIGSGFIEVSREGAVVILTDRAEKTPRHNSPHSVTSSSN